MASHDTVAPTEQAIDAYQRAREPKGLVIVPGGHFEAYVGPKHDAFARPAVEWFKKYLLN